MADFTLFEVHLHDGFESSLINNAPLLSKGADALTDAGDESRDDCDAEFDAEFDADESDEFSEADDAELGGHPGSGPLVRLVLPVGVAATVHYIHGGDDDLDEPADPGDADDEERDEVEVDA